MAGRTCPAIESHAVSSFAAELGESIDLQATASDPDAEDVLHFSWRASGGTLVRSDEARASFRCLLPGRQAITLAVNDGWCTAIDGFVVGCGAEEVGAGDGDTVDR
jgi:hypothetical protein